MEAVLVSPKFQIVIPRAVRETLSIRPGQKVQVIQYEDRIELIPMKPMREMRGFLKGIDTTVEREPDRTPAILREPTEDHSGSRATRMVDHAGLLPTRQRDAPGVEGRTGPTSRSRTSPARPVWSPR